MIVYNWKGEVVDLAYLKGKYGDFKIKPALNSYPKYVISALREIADDGTVPDSYDPEASSAFVVHVVDGDGNPIENARVAWYWPDAPSDPASQPACGVFPEMVQHRAVSGTTNQNGDVGFGMGGGAYYWPPNTGPHASWVYGANSELVLGIGMLAATNHYHFNVEFTKVDEAVPDPSPDPLEEVWAAYEALGEALRNVG